MNLFRFKIAWKFAWYTIKRPHRKGHGIHSPFLFQFINDVLRRKEKDPFFRAIEKLRKELRANKNSIEVEDFGAGSAKFPKSNRRIGQIAKYSSGSSKYGRLLFNICSYTQPSIIIELGTCLGISTSYLAKAKEKAEIYTIEGSSALHEIAKYNFEKLHISNVIATNALFENALPKLLAEIGRFDLLIIDGNHRKDAVLNYFKMSLPYIKSTSVIIFDDIRWSEGMLEAWLEICGHKSVKLSLDLFTLGIVFFDEKIIKQHFELFY